MAARTLPRRPARRRSGTLHPAAALALAAALSGCMSPQGVLSSRSMFTGARAPETSARTGANGAGDSHVTAAVPQTIAELKARRTILPPSGPYAQVAGAVLAAMGQTAAAELRVKRLAAQAADKNWLPRIGPSVSLTSLGALASSILVEQVLFDNGRKKAERAYAAADVEVAAVTLSTEMNDRVHEGLALYVKALKAQAQAQVADAAVTRMREYDRIMRARVKGGLSDMSEARVITQKLGEMQATAGADRDNARMAMAELNAMAQVPLDGVSGLSSLEMPAAAPEPLSVVRAEAEARRSIAEAEIARAAHLPGLTAQAEIGGGKPDLGLTLGADNLFGFNTATDLQAISASKEAARARAAEARQKADRTRTQREAQLRNLRDKAARGQEVLEQTRQTLETFTAQYRVGRRPLMELVSMYETYAALGRTQVGLAYDIALVELQIAAEDGLLVDGTNI
ncbi:TolC family protein [Phaeovulum vinaykumarii]|uniref:Outer membrane protein, adhesin transport system n=1 Tax=Phaeovulum vinaykumarii TaxID=407234 RepID=A0A1N7L051_9RHOB|nr:TolC family protein [Phaeovulum vinaykumarii]SIS67167.1 outer membrane protein, adhesin transport system [Phaeovulum vinaykumarii]SOC00818.1 adhesin transport system outer membrane protein [Phaeovulum vinaykumarii]